MLREAVVRLGAAGTGCVHAIGDRAVREALDAFAQARTVNGAADLRHHIAHIQMIHPDDDRASPTSPWPRTTTFMGGARRADEAELTLPFLGPERGRWRTRSP